ncbi:hypothetical protein MVI01_72330 [Myxococcus virescens]|uniref:Uncharacterized protein n=1 Tax=Myxococcus virescens TaxID=83456 RepID=A0A511HSH8_9BACT|nr:hypothetical protein MVI01_72330 [Myxococcus virescens]
MSVHGRAKPAIPCTGRTPCEPLGLHNGRRGNNRRASRPTGVSTTTYRCPGCGAQLERRGTLLLCVNDGAHPQDRSTRAYHAGRHGRLVPASQAAAPAWRAAVARLTGEPE